MLSGEVTGQEHLGALIADFVGLRGIEAVKVEAACGSGAAAWRGLGKISDGFNRWTWVSLGTSSSRSSSPRPG
jgi:acetyl-CoA C-acetyltransferase